MKALARAARAVKRVLAKELFEHGDWAQRTETGGSEPRQEQLDNPAANSALVEQAAAAFGAARTGICRLDPLWLYSCDSEGHSLDDLAELPWAVVMLVEMHAAAIRESPRAEAEAATGLGYMKGSVCASALGALIRELGYRAIATDNGLGLSIPLAADAGLGEMGRNGMLIAPNFGPCVRICKVLTDLPLQPSQPSKAAVEDACRKCSKCADTCPVGAIDARPEPSFDTVCESNNPGVLRWPVHAQKCLSFWRQNGGSCSSCIAACPFTPE